MKSSYKENFDSEEILFYKKTFKTKFGTVILLNGFGNNCFDNAHACEINEMWDSSGRYKLREKIGQYDIAYRYLIHDNNVFFNMTRCCYDSNYRTVINTDCWSCFSYGINELCDDCFNITSDNYCIYRNTNILNGDINTHKEYIYNLEKRKFVKYCEQNAIIDKNKNQISTYHRYDGPAISNFIENHFIWYIKGKFLHEDIGSSKPRMYKSLTEHIEIPYVNYGKVYLKGKTIELTKALVLKTMLEFDTHYGIWLSENFLKV